MSNPPEARSTSNKSVLQTEEEKNDKERLDRLESEEQPLLREPSQVGYDVSSVWHLNLVKPYPKAIPILLRHLSIDYSPVIRIGIAQSLAVREARDEWPLLVALYKKEPSGPLTAKYGLAASLAVNVTRTSLAESIDLARDSANGNSRVLLMSGLRRLRDPRAKEALVELEADPVLKAEIVAHKPRKNARG